MSDKAIKDAEQIVAEAEVEEDEDGTSPFVVAAESTRMPMVFTDAGEPDNPIIFANDSFLRLTGYDRDEVLAQRFNFMLASPVSDSVKRQIEACFEPGDDDSPEIHCRRKDGSEFWATLFANPVKDEHGDVVQHFVSLAETTRYKIAQRHAALLIDELNHRVKNTLATVQSIVRCRLLSRPAMASRASVKNLATVRCSTSLTTARNWSLC